MPLLDLTYDLFDLVASSEMSIQARYIPGRLNRLADLLSRRSQVVSTEWSLHPRVFHQICSRWGIPHVEPDGDQPQSQTSSLRQSIPRPKALAVDAMSWSWEMADIYVFPPRPMIQAVLQRLQRFSCLLTMVLPRWPNSPWFPLLLQSLVDFPR